MGLLFLLSFLLGSVYGVTQQCQYTDRYSGYILNMSMQSTWTFEFKKRGLNYYYTPCRNGLRCVQGNAMYSANVAEFDNANRCQHYLSVDHHTQPIYVHGMGGWAFIYEDGELCQFNNAPRKTFVNLYCNEESHRAMSLYDVDEFSQCDYVLNLRGYEACVPPNKFNEKCQYRVPSRQTPTTYHYLDLSYFQSINKVIVMGHSSSGFYAYYSPCANLLHCYQQSGHDVMVSVSNSQTGTCEHYGGIWEKGRVQPYLHNYPNSGYFWSFHYLNGQKCSPGFQGETIVHWICDKFVSSYVVVNSTYHNCVFVTNIASTHACVAEKKKHPLFPTRN